MPCSTALGHVYIGSDDGAGYPIGLQIIHEESLLCQVHPLVPSTTSPLTMGALQTDSNQKFYTFTISNHIFVLATCGGI